MKKAAYELSGEVPPAMPVRVAIIDEETADA
jgi:hypothetical protein